jgi:hypothetical protein
MCQSTSGTTIFIIWKSHILQRQVLAKLVEMDEKITLSKQMEEKNSGPVILINKFNVKPEDVARPNNIQDLLMTV